MDNSSGNVFKEWILPVLAALAIAIFINKTLFFKSKIPSTSMHPTIQKGDHIFVTRVYNTGNLKRGDIVLFNSKELNILLVKRLIGLPGDKIEINSDGELFINDVKYDEPYVVQKGGKAGSFNVPKDYFLFLGDNRADSYDSRYWNQPYIYKKDIVGKAWAVVFPFKRINLLK